MQTSSGITERVQGRMGFVDTQQQGILNPNVLLKERMNTDNMTHTSPMFKTTELLRSWNVLNSVS
jgi:hypothetical protein